MPIDEKRLDRFVSNGGSEAEWLRDEIAALVAACQSAFDDLCEGLDDRPSLQFQSKLAMETLKRALAQQENRDPPAVRWGYRQRIDALEAHIRIIQLNSTDSDIVMEQYIEVLAQQEK